MKKISAPAPEKPALAGFLRPVTGKESEFAVLGRIVRWEKYGQQGTITGVMRCADGKHYGLPTHVNLTRFLKVKEVVEASGRDGFGILVMCTGISKAPNFKGEEKTTYLYSVDVLESFEEARAMIAANPELRSPERFVKAAQPDREPGSDDGDDYWLTHGAPVANDTPF